ncbi:hypothetical protein JCM10450v2_004573 [Rhodotorula kratochvilovae]
MGLSSPGRHRLVKRSTAATIAQPARRKMRVIGVDTVQGPARYKHQLQLTAALGNEGRTSSASGASSSSLVSPRDEVHLDDSGGWVGEE